MRLARLRRIFLHEKIDTMRKNQLEQMLQQQNQFDMIKKLIEDARLKSS
jgi:hypothetical protein